MLGRLNTLNLTDSYCCGEEEHRGEAGQAGIPPSIDWLKKAFSD